MTLKVGNLFKNPEYMVPTSGITDFGFGMDRYFNYAQNGMECCVSEKESYLAGWIFRLRVYLGHNDLCCPM